MHVDKELYGDTFRAAPRLTPLEARAIRLALEYVGPMIAADAHTPLDARAQEARGDVRRSSSSRRRRSRTIERAEEDLVSTLARGMRENRLVEIEYQKEMRRAAVDARRRAVLARARSCRTGTCTRGTARATPSAPSGSTACAARS